MHYFYVLFLHFMLLPITVVFMSSSYFSQYLLLSPLILPHSWLDFSLMLKSFAVFPDFYFCSPSCSCRLFSLSHPLSPPLWREVKCVLCFSMFSKHSPWNISCNFFQWPCELLEFGDTMFLSVECLLSSDNWRTDLYVMSNSKRPFSYPELHSFNSPI